MIRVYSCLQPAAAPGAGVLPLGPDLTIEATVEAVRVEDEQARTLRPDSGFKHIDIDINLDIDVDIGARLRRFLKVDTLRHSTQTLRLCPSADPSLCTVEAITQKIFEIGVIRDPRPLLFFAFPPLFVCFCSPIIDAPPPLTTMFPYSTSRPVPEQRARGEKGLRTAIRARFNLRSPHNSH